jgi:hypothetical protein
MLKRKTSQKKSRVEFVDFDVSVDEVVDPGIVTRDGVTMCPFGKGMVCNTGCMVCDEGVRCCRPGETCYLTEQDTTNWCTGFRGTGIDSTMLDTGFQMGARDPTAAPRSFWER